MEQGLSKNDERKLRVAEMYTRGFSKKQIAEALGWGVDTVSQDIGEIHEEWARISSKDVNDRRMKHVATLHTLKRTLWSELQDAREEDDRKAISSYLTELRRVEELEARVDGSMAENSAALASISLTILTSDNPGDGFI